MIVVLEFMTLTSVCPIKQKNVVILSYLIYLYLKVIYIRFVIELFNFCYNLCLFKFNHKIKASVSFASVCVN